uniref:Uncharacterized protein n=1 Tax=Rhizophagus irregularis (strain DAOM 181602 / DAOM 197198 / MUCL 43194) TaxID=747089 RepID=U9TG70_RHIID
MPFPEVNFLNARFGSFSEIPISRSPISQTSNSDIIYGHSPGGQILLPGSGIILY